MTTRYKFAAVATYDTTPPVVSLPDCTAPAPPVVDFTSSPDDVAEGRVTLRARYIGFADADQSVEDIWSEVRAMLAASAEPLAEVFARRVAKKVTSADSAVVQ